MLAVCKEYSVERLLNLILKTFIYQAIVSGKLYQVQIVQIVPVCNQSEVVCPKVTKKNNNNFLLTF